MFFSCFQGIFQCLAHSFQTPNVFNDGETLSSQRQMTTEIVLRQPSRVNQMTLYKLFCESAHLCDSLSSVASFQTDLTNDLTSSWRRTSICSLSRKWTLSMKQRWAFKGRPFAGSLSCSICLIWKVVFTLKYCSAPLFGFYFKRTIRIQLFSRWFWLAFTFE